MCVQNIGGVSSGGVRPPIYYKSYSYIEVVNENSYTIHTTYSILLTIYIKNVNSS